MLLRSILILRLLLVALIAAYVISFSMVARSIPRHIRTNSLSMKDIKHVDEVIPAFSYGEQSTQEKFEEYKLQYARSISQPGAFWEEQAKKYLTWFSTPLETFSGSFSEGDVRWFAGGKLNACYNCLDRHLPHRADQTAIIWEADEPSDCKAFTYGYYFSAHICKLLKGSIRC